MSRREYLERKLEKRLDWAGKAQTRAEQAFGTADRIADGIPFGQPILIGHHSEGHARRDQERIHNAMSKGVEESDLAKHHASTAAGLERQLDHSIFSDDDNAVEALETRIAKREATAAAMVDLNKAWRKSKGDVKTFAELANTDETTAAMIAHKIEQAYSWEKQPHAAWELSNLRNLIRADKERIETIKVRAVKLERVEAAGGVEVKDLAYGSTMVTFAEKPDRSVINVLKAAGYYWSNPSWYGPTAKLPEGIRS